MRDLLLLQAMAIIAIALGIFFAGDGSGTLFGIAPDSFGTIAECAALLAGLGALLWFAALAMGVAALSAVFWGALGLAALVGFTSSLNIFQ